MNRTVAAPRESRSLFWMVAIVATLLALPMTARAQDANKIYDLSEVDAMPKLASSQFMARIINDAYPVNLRKAGVGGAVQMEFVVDANGKVEVSTIDAISNVPALVEAAKQVAPKLEFVPAKVKGTAVKSRVVLPLVFKP
jgi:protein TonB